MMGLNLGGSQPVRSVRTMHVLRILRSTINDGVLLWTSTDNTANTTVIVLLVPSYEPWVGEDGENGERKGKRWAEKAGRE